VVGDVTTKWATTAASASTSERPASGTATFAMSSTLSVSNKPMVPTAHTWPDGNPMDPMRRHMGRPLGSLESGERRPTKSTNRAAIGEETSAGQRTTGFDQWAASSNRRVTSNVARSGAT